MIRFSANLEPMPFKRVMQSGRRRYNDGRYTEFKVELGTFALKAMAGLEPLTGAVSLRVDFYKLKPKSPASRRWGDLDNHLKAVLDALNGICYLDDAQVVRLTGSKNYGEPRIEIRLETSENAACGGD